MRISVYPHDLPDDIARWYLAKGKHISFDCETTGLDAAHDLLRLVQLTDVANLKVSLVADPHPNSHNLASVLESGLPKYAHHAAFDMGFCYARLAVMPENVRCTRILARFAEPLGGRTGLAHLVRNYLGVEMDKSQQLAWLDHTGSLTEAMKLYAAHDVLHLYSLYCVLKHRLGPREMTMARSCFEALPEIAILNAHGCRQSKLRALMRRLHEQGYGSGVLDY